MAGQANVAVSHAGGFFATPLGRRWLFALLYVSEGAPMGFIWWALPTLLTARGVDLPTVTALSSLLTLPWVFKFLAGPVIDIAVRRGHLLRHWVTGCQLVMGVALLPLLTFDWTADLKALTVLLFVHSCCAATQDVAIDTLAIRSVPVAELGRINGWMQTGMLAGRACVAAAAVALVAAGYAALAILTLVALIWLPLLVLLRARPVETTPEFRRERPPLRWTAVLAWPVIPGVLIALTAGAGFEFFTVTAGPLLQGLGGSTADTTLLFGVVAPAGLALGALAGGHFAATRGARGGVAAGIALVAAAVGVLVAMQVTVPALPARAWLPLLALLYLAAGFLICTSYTLLMRMSRGDYAATRFSLYMSATNGCEAWAAFVGGRLSVPLGQNGAMVALTVASLLAMPLLLLRNLYTKEQDEQEE